MTAGEGRLLTIQVDPFGAGPAGIRNHGELTVLGITYVGGPAEAIHNDGVLMVRGSHFSGMRSKGDGAITNQAGATATIVNSSITGAVNTEVAGAIFNNGTMTISRSRINATTGTRSEASSTAEPWSSSIPR